MGRMESWVAASSENPNELEKVEKQMMGGCMGGLLHRIDPSHLLCLRSTKRIRSAGNSSTVHGKLAESGGTSPVLTPDNARAPTMAYRESPRFSFDIISDAVMSEKGKVSDARLSLDSRLELVRPRPIRTMPEYSRDDLEDRQRSSPSIVARLMGLNELPDSSSKGYSFSPPDPDSRTFLELRREVKQLVEQKISSGTREIVREKIEDSPWGLKQSQELQSVDIFRKGRCNGKVHDERMKIIGIKNPNKDLCSLKQLREEIPVSTELPSSANHRSLARANYIYLDSWKPEKARSSSSSAVAANATSCRRDLPQPNRLPIGQNCGRDIPVKRFKRSNNKALAPTPTRSTMFEAKARERPPILAPEMSTQGDLAVCPKASSTHQRRGADGNSPRRIGSPTRGVTARGGKPLQSSNVRSPRKKNKVNQEKLPASIRPPTCRKTTSCAESETNKSSRTVSRRDRGDHQGSVDDTPEQPSPVSVLDIANNNFCGNDDSPLSPVAAKRSIVFPGADTRYDTAWTEPFLLSDDSEHRSEDFRYLSEVVCISGLLHSPQVVGKCSNSMFSLLESHRGRDDSDGHGRLQRRLIFDAVMEILHPSSWHGDTIPRTMTEPYVSAKWLIGRVWSELQQIQRPSAVDAANDLFGAVNRVVENDLTVGEVGNNGWMAGCRGTMADVVLDMEGLIWKDLIFELTNVHP